EDGIRDFHVTGVQTCALPICRHLELLPYVTARSELIAGGPGNPFNDGSRAFAGAGLDVKYGLSGNLTLDATVNPDFGQVEVDPRSEERRVGKEGRYEGVRERA